MPLYMARKTLNQHDAAAAEAATEPLIQGIREQYKQALAPEPMQQPEEPQQPAFAPPSLESLGVAAQQVAPSITSVIGAVPGMAQRARQVVEDVTPSWVLPSLESLGVSQPKPPEPSYTERGVSPGESGTPDAENATPSQVAQPALASPVAPTPTGVTSAPGYAPSSGRGAEGVERWSDLVAEAARAYNLPEATIKGLMEIESGGNPEAVSHAGALGLMQVMPFHFKPGENGKDPRTNIMRGAKVYADALARWGDPDKAAAAYFGAIDGAGNITNATDGSSVNGHKYVQLWREAASKYGPSSPNAGAAPPQAAPATAPQPPTTGSTASSPPAMAAGGSGGGEITVRHKRTGLESRVTPDQLAQMTNRDEFEVVGGAARTPLSDTAGSGPSSEDAYRVPLVGDPMQQTGYGDPLPAPMPGNRAGEAERNPPLLPGVTMLPGPSMTNPVPDGQDIIDRQVEAQMYRQPLAQPSDEALPGGVDVRGRKPSPERNIEPLGPALSGAPWEYRYSDAQGATLGTNRNQPRVGEPPIEYTEAPLPLRNAPVQGEPIQEGYPGPETILYRAPLLPTDPEASTGTEWVDPDQGPRETGYTVPGPGAAWEGAGSTPASAVNTSPSGSDTQPGQSPGGAAPTPLSYDDPDAGPREAIPGSVGAGPVGPLYGPEPAAPVSAIGAVENARAGMADQEELAPRSGGGIIDTLGAAAGAARQAVVDEVYPTDPVVQATNAGKLPMQRGLELIQAAVDAGNTEIGRRIGRAAGLTDDELFTIWGIPVSAEDIAGFAGSVVLDPTNLISAGPARRAVVEAAEQARPIVQRGARELAEEGAEAARGLGTRVRGALDANAANVAAADARMAAEGSTAAPGTLGAIPEEFGRPYPDIRRDVRGTVRESLGEPSSEMLADSRYPREAVHPDIRAAGIGPEITPQIDLSGRANASAGTLPDARTADPLSAVNRVLGQGGASMSSGGTGAAVAAVTDPGSSQGEDESDADYAVRRTREIGQRMGTGFAVGALGPVLGANAVRKLVGRRGATLTDEALATLGNVPNTPQGNQIARSVARAAAQQQKPANLMEVVQAYRHSVGMLGNVGTGLLNAIGGPVSAADALAVDAVRTGLFKGYPVPVVYEAASLMAGLKEASRNALGTALGFIPDRVRNAPDFRPPLAERMGGPVGKAIGYAIDTPGRLATQTPDAFFGTLFERMGRTRAAAEIMMENGVSRLDPAAQVDEINRLLSTPTADEAKRIEEAARKFSQELTYKGEPGPVERAIGGAFRPGGGRPTTANDPLSRQVHDLVGSFIMPFYGSIFKIHKLAASHIPIVGEVADRSHPASERIARQVVGLGFGIWAADRAAQGLVTGPGPDDPDEKARLKASGWDEWSTFVPGVGYVKSDNFAQAGPILKMVGAYYDDQRYRNVNEQDGLKQGDKTVKTIMRSFESFPVVEAVKALVAMAESPVKGGADLAITVGSSFVPAVVRSAEAAKDPYQRTVDTNAPLAEQTKQRAVNRVGSVPGLGSRQDSPPALNRETGEPVENPRRGIGAFIPQPVNPKPTDPLIQEMSTYGVTLDRSRDRFTFTRAGADAPDGAPGSVPVPLAPAWQQEWLKARREGLEQAAGEIQGSPQYQGMNEAQRRAIWKRAVEAAERYADRAVKSAHQQEIERTIRGAPATPVRRAS